MPTCSGVDTVREDELLQVNPVPGVRPHKEAGQTPMEGLVFLNLMPSRQVDCGIWTPAAETGEGRHHPNLPVTSTVGQALWN